MPAARVGPGLLADQQAVVNVPPMLGRGFSRIDAERLDDIDRLQDFLDLRPAGETQQAFSAWAHEGHGRVTLAGPNGAQDVDPRDHSAVVVGGTTNEGKDAARREGDNAPLAIETRSSAIRPKRIQFSDALLEEGQLDMSEFIMRLLRCRRRVAQQA